MAEFCRADLAAALGISVVAAGKLIGDALDLRHRLPLLWAAVQTGDVTVWMARKVAVRTRALTLDAARKVDASTAGLAATLPYPRLEAVVEAAILRADPAQATSDVEAAIAGQGVWFGRENRHGIGTVFGKATVPDLKALDLYLDTVARAMSVLGDTDPYDLRRAKALGVMANPTAALDLIRLANEALTTEPPEPTRARAHSATEDGARSERGVGPRDGTDPRRGCDLGPATLYVHVTQQSLADEVDGTRRRHRPSRRGRAGSARPGARLARASAGDNQAGDRPPRDARRRPVRGPAHHGRSRQTQNTGRLFPVQPEHQRQQSHRQATAPQTDPAGRVAVSRLICHPVRPASTTSVG